MSWFGGGTATPAAPTASVAPFSFGAAQQPASTPTASFGGFGMTNPAPASAGGFSFGQPSAAPAFGTPASTATPAATSFSFGTPAAQQPQPAATSAPTFGGFGMTNPTPAPAPGASGFSFGQTTPAPAYGTPASTAAAPTATPFSFGTNTQPTAGTPASTSFGLGGTANPATSSGATNFSFGTPAPTAPATNFSFGTPASTATAATSTAASTATPFTLGFGTSTSQPAASGATTFGFGTTTTASTAPKTGTGLSIGLGIPSFGTPTSLATTSQQPLVGGLGGIAGNQGNTFGTPGMGGPGGLIGGRHGESGGVKELPIPAELLALVDEVKSHLKNEKVKMAEVTRASYRNIEQVTGVLDDTRAQILNISNVIQRLTHNCETFRQELVQDVRDAEMAHMTRDTPMVLQADNPMPMEYFYRLVQDYENRMVVYKREIRKAEAAIAGLGSSVPMNAKDLCLSLKSVKDSLVIIAAKVKTLHERVNAEVDTHKNLLRFLHGETGRDIFAERSERSSRWEDSSKTGLHFPSRKRGMETAHI